MHVRTQISHIPLQVISEFIGREDRLIYRSGLYDPGATEVIQAVPGVERIRGSITVESLQAPKQSHILVKVSEKFSRNIKVAADSDVAKRIFDYGSNITRVDYHYEENGVVRPFMTYDKNSDVPRITGFKVNVFVPKPTYAQMVEEFNALCEAERMASNAIAQSNTYSDAVSQRYLWILLFSTTHPFVRYTGAGQAAQGRNSLQAHHVRLRCQAAQTKRGQLCCATS